MSTAKHQAKMSEKCNHEWKPDVLPDTWYCRICRAHEDRRVFKMSNEKQLFTDLLVEDAKLTF